MAVDPHEQRPGATGPDRTPGDGGRPGPASVVTDHTTATIERSVDDVTRYVFDPTTMPHWSAVLYEIEPTDDLEPRLARGLRANLKVLGVRVTVAGELVAYDPVERSATVRIVPAGGDGAIEHRLRVEGTPARSVVHFWNRVEVPTWLADHVEAGLVHRFLRHTATFALATIKDILESGQEDDVRRMVEATRRLLPPPLALDPAVAAPPPAPGGPDDRRP